VTDVGAPQPGSVEELELGERLRRARHGAQHSQKEAASELGIPIWELDDIERGLRNDQYEARLEKYLTEYWQDEPGQPGDAWGPLTVTDDPDTLAAPPAEPNDRLAVALVLASLAGLVLIRLFTETVPLLPRVFNAIDVAIFAALIGMAAIRPSVNSAAPALPRWLFTSTLAFLALCLVAAMTNLDRVDLGPVIVFLYTTLGPVAVFAAVRTIWPVGNGRAALGVLLVLGAVQLVIGLTVNAPAVLQTEDVDRVSGTFGTNPYQFVVFLTVLIGALAMLGPSRAGGVFRRFAPVMIAAALVLIVLAQFRAYLPILVIVLLFITALLSRIGTRGLATALVPVAVLAAVLTFSAQSLPFLKLSDTDNLGPLELASERISILTGTGPGAYSSRAWQTFALSESTSRSNVVGGYAIAVTGGETYTTDVSEKYVRPLLGNVVAGSYAVTSPYSSYISVAAEIGLLGMVLLLVIYLGAFLTATQEALAALEQRRRGPLVPLLAAAAVAFLALLFMGLLQNWMEVTRLTFIAWILLAIGTKEAEAPEAERAR
jgi:transcriptional regulator with XRE-family HTH domain